MASELAIQAHELIKQAFSCIKTSVDEYLAELKKALEIGAVRPAAPVLDAVKIEGDDVVRVTPF